MWMWGRRIAISSYNNTVLVDQKEIILSGCVCRHAHIKEAKTLMLTNSKSRITVDSLNKFFAFVTNNPVGINLRCSLRIQGNHLESTEVCLTYVNILRADVINVINLVIVKIIFACIAPPITWQKKGGIRDEFRKKEMNIKAKRGIF